MIAALFLTRFFELIFCFLCKKFKLLYAGILVVQAIYVR
ncbi:hypothetical protein AB28_1786 [Raoultella ornithinolytica 2-156-04_S1_C2]|nr:hypothetical protein AB00_2898 [Raoultella ornithinolytica 2-156-04_S1_C1]KDX15681.1 hypothetical protein AB28_1786 [Raoultella ornithinolytica 2-156-04_S1_C2]